ncbi:aminotransferase class I/II-fold pyridoxal phosphate-dependent enzyme [Halosquirtibacter laminarini]|uniref:Aminotransferase class I/II-fold pyridoxal phosphate-dependent enzyme n=1 Tax=Halosquirtibacter laminarini TaxID=3374600 RepID=A0AC61NQE7_9BACT|nr:aminotransferase class I/II-fold pyridoxal phosphate-dependent enzyme [Prolixibacteraceae bacterium]
MHYGHGDDSYRFEKEIVANHSTNIWPKGPSNDLLKHLQQNLHLIGSYPECFSESLTQKLSVENKVPIVNIGVFNGIAEAIYLIAQSYRSCRSMIVTPTFSEYEDATSKYSHQITYIDENSCIENTICGQDIVWICNPNNPTGKLYPQDILSQWIDRHPNTLFVIDEAYMDLVYPSHSLVEKVPACKNLIVMHSLTKNYAIPGLRLGVVYASQEILERLHEFRPPWSVNSIAIEAGKYLVDHPPYDKNQLQEYLEESKRLQQLLKRIDGISLIEGETGFFTLKTPIKSDKLKSLLITKYGILVRDASNFRGLSPYHIRIASLNRTKNLRLIQSLTEILDNDEH